MNHSRALLVAAALVLLADAAPRKRIEFECHEALRLIRAAGLPEM